MAKLTHSSLAPRKRDSLFSSYLSPGVLSILVILLFAVAFWWVRIQHTDAVEKIVAGANSDMYMYHLPVREFGFSRLKTGTIPLWNPYTSCGMPFLATYQAALFYPLNFPHWFLPGNIALSIVYLVHIFVAGLFMYLWIRELGGAPLAATFAAIAYALCSFVNYTLAWPHIILGHTWIPAIFLLLHRTYTRARWTDSVLLGVVVTCQFLTGYMQGMVYTFYGAFCYLFFMTIADLVRPEHRPANFFRSFLFTLIGLSLIPALLGAIQWIPTYELSGLSTRPPGNLAPEAILVGGSLFPSTFFSALANPESFSWVQYTLYPGILTLVMAAFAFVQKENWRHLSFFSLLAVCSAIIAFGTHTPIFNLFMLLPTGGWFRLPNRLLILAAFSFATLAGLGIDLLIREVLAKTEKTLVSAGRYAALIAICGALILALPKTAGLYVFVLLVACLLGIRAQSASLVGVLAILLVGLDLMLYVFNPVTYPWITPDVFPDLKEERTFLKEHASLDRVHVFRKKHDWKNYLWNANFGMIEGIRETGGYETLSLQRYAEFCAYMDTGTQPSVEEPFTGRIRWSSASVNPKMLNLLGARYIVEDTGRDLHPEKSPANKMPNAFELKKVFSGTLKIYENPDALSRVVFVKDFEVVGAKRAILERLADPAFAYRKTVILEEQPKLPATRANASDKSIPAEMVVETPGEGIIEIVVNIPESGFILLNDMFVPGWRATTDGTDTTIYRANYLFMAIPVGAGKHVIEVQYQPNGFRIGRWISFLSIVALALTLAFDVARRRSKRMSPWEQAGKVEKAAADRKKLGKK